MGRDALVSTMTVTKKAIRADAIHPCTIRGYKAESGEAITEGMICYYDPATGTIKAAIGASGSETTTYLMVALEDQVATTDYANDKIKVVRHGGVVKSNIFYKATPTTALTTKQAEILAEAGLYTG